MNLTELIFKYIDGTITRQEDAIMRQMMEEDPALKQEFITLLNLDFELRKDAKVIDYPDDFFNDIKDEIKKKIQKDNQKTYSKKKFQKNRNFATTLVIMLILIISNIQNPINNIIKISNTRNYAPPANEKISSNIIPLNKSNNTKRYKATQKNFSKQITLSTLTTIGAETYNISNFNFKNQDRSTNLLGYIDDDQFTNFANNNNLQLDNAFLSSMHQKYNIQNNIPKLSEKLTTDFNPNFISIYTSQTNYKQVELNSFFGTDIASFGVNKSSSTITSFTQSIAYDLNPKSKIGIETGYLQVEVDKGKYLDIEPSSLDEFGSSVNSGGSSLLIRTPGKENLEQSIIWAGIFYERNLIEYSNITLSSRLGAGLSDNGFIGNVKLIAMYRLSKSINFTLGGETKFFSGQSEYLNNNNSFNSTISLIYGVHFGF